jgi:outer membrane lipoprotein
MKSVLSLLVLALAGCASDIPRPIREAPAVNITRTQALQNPEQYRGAAVRWGGTIAAVENRRDATWIDIVERPLDANGEPRRTDKSAGRFLARVDSFLDPTIFAQKRQVTVAGSLDGNSTGVIGEHPYTYPVVHVETIYIWPQSTRMPPYYYPSPYYWYGPWYPWGYPYYYYYPYRHPR